ncbi:hypothetical protein [Polyangium fumosum]|uniref:Uncharacterized protein n=1 Tax=Polyangium fumosum TaxID=889272 RepID=A0A4U1JE59_9BACT|nr:hypothetical protein [Polyangium fumosum]TKD08938.1 hypothetical protein E8A74_14230 [Polyangium fumosum]
MGSLSQEQPTSVPAAPPQARSVIVKLDPDILAAVLDVDRTLIQLSLQQSPWDRLRSASRMMQTLARIRDAAASQRG